MQSTSKDLENIVECRGKRNTGESEASSYEMTDKVFDNNQVTIAGEIISNFTFSHDVFGEGFYLMEISVGRLSESNDVIPIMVSERLVDVKQDYTGMLGRVELSLHCHETHQTAKLHTAQNL